MSKTKAIAAGWYVEIVATDGSLQWKSKRQDSMKAAERLKRAREKTINRDLFRARLVQEEEQPAMEIVTPRKPARTKSIRVRCTEGEHAAIIDDATQAPVCDVSTIVREAVELRRETLAAIKAGGDVAGIIRAILDRQARARAAS